MCFEWRIFLHIFFVWSFVRRCKLRNLVGTVLSREVLVRGGKANPTLFEIMAIRAKFNANCTNTLNEL